MSGFPATFPATWVLVADSARARIFSLPNLNDDLVELADLTNSQARLTEQALTSDRPGQTFASRGHSPRRMQNTKSEVENAVGYFARELAGELKSGLAKQRYERFVLIAPPGFLGELRNQLDSQVNKRLVGSVALNLTKQDIATIRTHLPRLSALGE